MSKRGKPKGNSGERELAKLLSNYFGDSFLRVPNSGAYVGGSNAYRKNSLTEKQINLFKADIITPESLPHFVAESKFYADFPYHRLVKGETVPKLDEWIEELEHDCEEDDIGFLCIKINYKGWMVAFPAELKAEFEVDNYTKYKNYIITGFDQFFENNKHQVVNICS